MVPAPASMTSLSSESNVNQSFADDLRHEAQALVEAKGILDDLLRKNRNYVVVNDAKSTENVHIVPFDPKQMKVSGVIYLTL
jgi:hypothetical protein